MKSLGERVTHAIDSLDIKRTSIPKRGGPSRATLWRIEHDLEWQPSVDALKKLVKAFRTYGVSEEWIRVGKEPMIMSPLATLTAGELTRAAETAEPYSARVEPALDRKRLIDVLTIVLSEAPNKPADQLATIVLTAYDQAIEGKSLDQIREKVRMWFS